MNTNQVASKKGTTSGINYVTWYRMYARQSLYSDNVLKNVDPKTTKTSSMIWGSQYDQIMIWIKNIENDKETTREKYYVTNGAGKGNYGKITINGNEIKDGNDNTTSPASTGSQNAYRVKNIYDLAGNVYEWSLEANYTRPDNPFNYDPTTSGSSAGSRLSLY